MKKTVMVVAVAAASLAFAGEFAVELDIDGKPLKDIRKADCVAGLGFNAALEGVFSIPSDGNDDWWFITNRVESARVLKNAGASLMRLQCMNSWWNRRDKVTKKGYPSSNPKAAFDFYRANHFKVFVCLEAWNWPAATNCVEIAKWLKENGYENEVAGIECGNETYGHPKYEEFAPRWDYVIREVKKFWPKAKFGINIAEYFELNPDLAHMRARMLSDERFPRDNYFSAGEFNHFSTKYLMKLKELGTLPLISHVIWHAYGAETPYSCSYHGMKRFREYCEAFPELKGKQWWLTEIRERSDEDNRCQRMFRETLIMAHYHLMAITQPEVDAVCHHQLNALSGAIYQSDGRGWYDQWYDSRQDSFADLRSPYDMPRLSVGHCGVMYRILTEGLRLHPLIFAHGTSKGMNDEDSFYTSARVTDQVYALRKAKKERKVGGIGEVRPQIEGEVEYLATMNPGRNRLCLLMVNTKPVAETIRLTVKDRQFAAPVYRTLSCPEEYLDCREIPDEGRFWTQRSWEDTQSGYSYWANYITKGGGYRPLPTGLDARCDDLIVEIAPNTVQSVEVELRKAVKKEAVARKADGPDHVFFPIADSEKYEKLNPRFRKAFEFLKRGDLATLAPGGYILEEGPDANTPAIKAMVQEVELRPYGLELQRCEAHGKYIDIQAPLSGNETFGICSFDCRDQKWGYADAKDPKKQYPDAEWKFDASRDVGFIDLPCTKVTVKPGEAAIFFPPHGAHAPCLSDSGARKLRKVVIKVLADTGDRP